MGDTSNVRVREATQIQKSLRHSVRLVPLARPTRSIAGADISYERFSDHFFAAVAVFSYPELGVLEVSYAEADVDFPYVPGYLSFREVPVIREAFRALRLKPDVLMMDGHGIAHPRRVGVATHLGLEIGIPTIGCAKSRLYGEADVPGEERGEVSQLRDPVSGEQIGVLLRTKRNVKPIYVSPGHLITHTEAASIALTCTRAHRIPEPTRVAHELANELRRSKRPEDGAY